MSSTYTMDAAMSGMTQSIMRLMSHDSLKPTMYPVTNWQMNLHESPSLWPMPGRKLEHVCVVVLPDVQVQHASEGLGTQRLHLPLGRGEKSTYDA